MPADPDNMDWNLNVIVRGTIITMFVLALCWSCFWLGRLTLAVVPPQHDWHTDIQITDRPIQLTPSSNP